MKDFHGFVPLWRHELDANQIRSEPACHSGVPATSFAETGP
jgi:hypothetical protein